MVAFDPHTGLLPCVAEFDHVDARTAIAYRICVFAYGGECECERRAKRWRETTGRVGEQRACERALDVADGILTLARAYEGRER
ncbi:hypothetical protein RA307_31430 [Xanthobacteraceae bacterium Astr-EGSB]|uniref:hypothetical protein n=1 Tax=Astrobacterium formosum TaxID=3069710 RepID=UPI0027B0CD3A|nr:hypothetical protein [Xanthobacteraceae bacterium Astr-EGSB]